MLGVETLATQTLATSARELPFVARFAAVQGLATYDLIYLVELQPYLPAQATVATVPKPIFTTVGQGGGVSSGISQYSYQPVPTGVVYIYQSAGGGITAGTAVTALLVGGVARVYVGKAGAVSAGAATTQLVVGAPAPLPTVAGLWARYDADRFANSLTIPSGNSVSAWADSSGVTAGAPDIGLSLDFSGLTPDLDMTFARASSKVVYRSGPTIALTGTGQQALTTSRDGATALGLLVEGTATQLVQNSKLSGGGTNPTGWAAITSGTRTPVTSVLGNADGATAYQLVAATTRPHLTRTFTFQAGVTYTMSCILESLSGVSASSLDNFFMWAGVINGECTGQQLILFQNLPTQLPALVSFTFKVNTPYTGGVSTLRWGPGSDANVTATAVISRPQLTADPGPVSFIPSNDGQTVITAADVGSVALTAANWNNNANTLVLKGRTASFNDGVVEQNFFQIDSGGFNNSFKLLRWIDRHLHYQIWSGGVNQVDFDFGIVADDTDFTVRAANAPNNVRISFNGGAVLQDTVATISPGMTTLRVGMEATGGTEWYGTINTIEIWKSAKPDSELQNGIIAQGAGGGGPALSQSTIIQRPTRIVAGQNGRDTVDFNPAAFSYLASPLTTSFDAFWAGGAYILMAVRVSGLGAQSLGRFIYRAAVSGGWLIGLQAGTAGSAQLRMTFGYTTTSATYTSSNFAIGPNFRVIEISFDTATPATPPIVRLNGTLLAMTVVSAAVGSYTEAANQPITFSDPTFAFDGEFGDVVFYGSVPIAGDQTALRSWATTKWNAS